MNTEATKHIHLAVLFERRMTFPPNIDDIKVFYISNELIRRGAWVTWVEFEGKDVRQKRNKGIQLVTLPINTHLGPLSASDDDSQTVGILLDRTCGLRLHR